MTRFAFHPLTLERWSDLERLFGPSGACGGCWCMWWRIKRSEFDAQHGAENKAALKRLVRSGRTLGLLAYEGSEVAGWMAIEPRERYPVLARSHVLKPVDDEPVWSVTCFFVRRESRGQGLTRKLLDAAAKHVAGEGGGILEAYPVDPQGGELANSHVFTGLASTFLRAGFREVARRSPKRPILRRAVKTSGRPR